MLNGDRQSSGKRFQNNDNDAPKTQKLSGENARSNKHD